MRAYRSIKFADNKRMNATEKDHKNGAGNRKKHNIIADPSCIVKNNR